MNVSVTVDLQTGVLTGTISRSEFPAAQIFFDGQSIAELPASAGGPTHLMAIDESGQIQGVQICDPSR